MVVDAGTINSEVRLLLADLKNDVLKVEKNLANITKASKKVSKDSTLTFGKLKNVLVGLGAIEVGRRLISGFASLIKKASDAAETTSKLRVVFRGLGKEADAATKDLIENYGLSSKGAQQLLGDTGDLLSGFGFQRQESLKLSIATQKLAVDLASFTNFAGGAEGASQALTKALLGERESVKALGISILETDVQNEIFQLRQEGLTFETERQAKAFATLRIAQRQSANAIGDFARTSQGFANQLRILRARLDDIFTELGSKFLPIAEKAIQRINGFFDPLRKAAEQVRKFEERFDIGFRIVKVAIFTARLALNSFLVTFGRVVTTTFQGLKLVGKQFINFKNAVQAAFSGEGLRAAFKSFLDGALDDAKVFGKEYVEPFKDIKKDAEELINFLIKGNEELDESNKTTGQNNLDLQNENNQAKEETIALTKKQAQLLEELAFKEKELSAKGAELAILKVEQERNKALEIAKGNQQAIDAVNSYYDKLRETEAYEANKKLEEDLFRKRFDLAQKTLDIFSDLFTGIYDTQVNIAEAALNEIGELGEDATEEEIAQREKAVEAERKAKLDAFNASKAFRIADLIISGIQNAAQAFALAVATFPPPGGLILGGTLAGLIGGGTTAGVVQIASKNPNFQFGGVVPGNRTQGVDSVPINATPKEVVLTEEQQARFTRIANGEEGARKSPSILQIITQTGEVLREFIFNETKNGEMQVHANGIVFLEEVT
jgi:hypothetical protein